MSEHAGPCTPSTCNSISPVSSLMVNSISGMVFSLEADSDFHNAAAHGALHSAVDARRDLSDGKLVVCRTQARQELAAERARPVQLGQPGRTSPALHAR